MELAKSGARVALVQRSLYPLQRTEAEIRRLGGIATSISADLRFPDQIESAIGTARSALGPIDILVNNAGYARPAAGFLDAADETWREVLALNLTAPYLCAKAVVPDMMEQGWGRILNIAAIQAYRPLPGNAPYAASKGGIISLTRSMAVDLTRHGIIVNAIAPGPFDTHEIDLVDTGSAPWPTLVGRRGRPVEIAHLASFMTSDLCSFVVGQVVVCDGGRLLSREAELPWPDERPT
jgi:NAD(P)-dependent dehydrogenase (short-subunit alcohol dehydrogenase family)